MQINWKVLVHIIMMQGGFNLSLRIYVANYFQIWNLLGNKQFRYLHANPNNHGLETEPIYDEVNKCWIGFQAKFFESNVKYDQIKHSAEKTIRILYG